MLVEYKIPDRTVIVIDNSQYKNSYSEKPPFKAKIIMEYDGNVQVKSLTTNKEYELYPWQILEFLENKKIKELIDISKL
jgi:hypothetical protein